MHEGIHLEVISGPAFEMLKVITHHYLVNWHSATLSSQKRPSRKRIVNTNIKNIEKFIANLKAENTIPSCKVMVDIYRFPQ
jgi:hypothetical protein